VPGAAEHARGALAQLGYDAEGAWARAGAPPPAAAAVADGGDDGSEN
jgi:hypothetical protein